MSYRFALPLATAVVLLAACNAGSSGQVPGLGASPRDLQAVTPEPTAATQIFTLTDPDDIQAAQCMRSRSGVIGDVPWVVVTVSLTAEGQCESDGALDSSLDCVGNGGAPTNPDAIRQLLDCLKATYPDAAIATGPELPANPGSGIFMDRQPTGPSTASCSSSGADPRLSGDGLGTFKTVVQLGPVVYASDDLFTSYAERATAASTPETDDDAAAQAKLDEASKVYDQTVEAAEAGEDIPTETDVEGVGLTIWQTIVQFVTGKVVEEETEPAPDENPEPAPVESGERPEPVGEDSACDSILGALAECDKISYATETCKLLRDQLSNPNCDPTIAYVLEGRACQSSDLTDEEKEALLSNAILHCWSQVNPDPGSDGPSPCVLRTPDNSVMYLSSPRDDVCGSPIAMIENDQCVGEMVDPAAVATALVGNKRDMIDAVLTGTDPNPIPGPGPK